MGDFPPVVLASLLALLVPGMTTAEDSSAPPDTGVYLSSLPGEPPSPVTLHQQMQEEDEAGDRIEPSPRELVTAHGEQDFVWASAFTGPGVDQVVNATAVWDDGSGPALYVGGEFRTAGEHVVHRVARWDGSQWSPLTGSSGTGVEGGFTPRVNALAVYDGALIVAGQFTTAGGQTVNNIARWDGSEWSALASDTGIGVDNWVNALTVYDGALIAGGQFVQAGGVTVNRVARWDGESWSALGGPAGIGVNSSVDALTVFEGDLIAGGIFFQAGGVTVSNIASWDGNEWSPLEGPSGTGVSGWVFALTVHDGALIAGGSFANAGGVPVNRVARWDGAEWSALAGGVGDGLNDSVRALTVLDGELFAGGELASVGGTAANHLVRWSDGAWLPLAGPLAAGADGPVATLTPFAGELVAGGVFTAAGGRSANHVARWDGEDWSALEGPLGTGLSDSVSALTVYEGDLIAGGDFTGAGGTIVNHIARWDGDGWSALSGPSGTGTNGRVMALAVYDGDLIVGGEFTQAGGAAVNNIARWDGSGWSPLIGPAGTGVDRWVDALLVFDGDLIAGGAFRTAGGLTVNSIARWNGSEWSALGEGMNLPNSGVNALTEFEGALIAGGTFPQAGGVIVNHVARWDGTAWSSLGSGMSDTVFALEVFDGELIAGGPFTQAGGTGASHIARWNGSTWSELGGGVSGGPVLTWVGALTAYDGALIAGGPFTQAGAVPANFVARWDGGAWSALTGPAGNGVDDTVFELATIEVDPFGPSAEALVAAGAFLVAGGVPNWGLGVYSPTVDFAVSPDPLVFGAVLIGETRGPLGLTLTNNGASAVTVTAVSAPEPPFAAAGGTCGELPLTLPAGESCALDYTFAPTAAGDASTAVTIDSDALSGPHTVTLSGTGSEEPLHFAPDPLAFGIAVVGETRGPLSVTLTNAGAVTVNVSAVSAPAAPFAAAGGTCGSAPFSLDPFASCTLDFTFAPTTSGNAGDTIQVSSDAPGSPHGFDLQGEGVERELSIAPDPLDFGGVDVGETSAVQSVTLENTGPVVLNVHEIGEPEAPFAVVGGSCGTAPLAIPAGASCTLDYTFSPPVTGDAATTVTIASNAPSSPATVTLQGIGTGAAIALDPESLAVLLDADEVEPRPLSVGNEGNEPLEWQVVEETFVFDDTETTITHSASLEVLPEHTNACASGSGTGDNRFLRTFTLPDFGIPSGFQVTEVSFGVQTLTLDTAIAVNLYTLEGDLVYANLTPIGGTTVALESQSLSHVAVPVTGMAPPGSTLVVEIAAPALGSVGGFFFAGSNDLGETAPSYVAAPGCGTPEPTAYSELGFPDVHLVMTVTGLFEPLDCVLPAWTGVDPLSGTVPAGESQEATVTFDASGLASGIYDANLCLTSNDPLRPLAVVPLELTVSGPFPVLDVSPPAVDFEVVSLGQSRDVVLTLANPGDADLSIQQIGAPLPPFELLDGTCETPQTLGPGESCTLVARFTPPAEGVFTGGFEIVSNATTSPDEVSFVGIGFDFGEGVQKLTASDGAADDRLGSAVDLSADTAVVAAPGATVDGNLGQGAVYVFIRQGDTWSEQAKLTAADGAAFEGFGGSVAVASDTLLVGAPSASVDGNFGQGAAYVFTREGGAWNLQAKLTKEDGESFDNFGSSVALAGDTAVVGARSANVEGNNSQGAIFVFTRDGDTWSQQAALTADDGAAFDNLGGSVALADGTVLAGAPGVDLGGNNSQGAAYVFTGAGGTWSQQAKLVAGDGGGFHNFGVSVALSGDTALVGADGAVVNGGFGRGAAYVFLREEGTWNEQAKLIAGDGAGSDRFGIAVSLVEDTALVGAWQADIGGSVDQGVAYLFTRDAGVWSEEAKLLAADGAPADAFGTSVALTEESALVGAPGADVGGHANRGAAYFFALGAGAPELAFDPSSLDFGDVEVGTTSPPQIATLENTGDAEATGLDFGAPGNGFDAETSDCGISLAAGASCEIVVTFTPPGTGTASTELFVDTVEGASALLDLSGQGVESAPPELIFVPPSLDFGEVEVGETSPPQVATLENAGDVDATGLTFSLPGSGFEADTGACGDTLPAGESCSISVTFTPGEPGAVEATLEVTSDQGASASLGLSGNGVGDEGFTAMALEVDPDELGSDGNRVFEPGELVEVAPAWHNDGTTPQSLSGDASDLIGPEGATYTLAHDGADYGALDPEQTASCLETGVCYQVSVDDPAVRPASHWEATFDETLDDSDGTSKTWTLHIGDSFVDVPRTNLFYPPVETMLHHGVTGGCTETEYCPTANNTRDQMPVFVLRALEGADYEPPACVEGDEMFHDVAADNVFCPWIEELFNRGVVSGCGGGNYCPNAPVTRAQMAIFLLRSLEGADYEPPACTGQFVDVPCPSLFADWIEELFAREITGGCSNQPPRYCPARPVNREQMAAFIGKAFELMLYGP